MTAVVMDDQNLRLNHGEWADRLSVLSMNATNEPSTRRHIRLPTDSDLTTLRVGNTPQNGPPPQTTRWKFQLDFGPENKE